MKEKLEFTRDSDGWLNASLNPFSIHIIPEHFNYVIVFHFGSESLTVKGITTEEKAVSKAHDMAKERARQLVDRVRIVVHPQEAS